MINNNSHPLNSPKIYPLGRKKKKKKTKKRLYTKLLILINVKYLHMRGQILLVFNPNIALETKNEQETSLVPYIETTAATM